MKNSFTRNLQIGFGLSLLLLLLSSIASYYSIKNLISSSELLNHTNQVLQESENVISYMKDAETGQRGFLVTDDLEFLEPYNGSFEKTKAALDNLKELTRDNIDQQARCDSLYTIIIRRYNFIQQGIDQFKQNRTVDFFLLRNGKIFMDQARQVVIKIQNAEKNLLAQRTASLNKYSAYTPPVIIIAALLALSITIVFFKKINDEYAEKVKLNETLDRKEKEIITRINIIEKIARQISAGDYKIRLDNKDNDGLGDLSVSLNKMAESLDNSFSLITENEWLQKGSAQLGERMAGEKDVHSLSAGTLDFIVHYTNSQIGAFYLTNNNTQLYLQSSYGISGNVKNQISAGEGIVGQSFSAGTEVLLNEIEEDLYINVSAGNIKPKNIVACPIFFERRVIGVIELGSIHIYGGKEIEFLKNVAGNIGTAVNTAYNRTRLQELLEETQAQTEELQAQHSELENLNTELEAQTEKLQISEEELKVQQEELMETNQELEERSRLLEEKNHLIVVRNLEIQKKAEELALSTKYKSEFLANMSHELRTPLNSILLLSRLLSENNNKTLNKEEVEYANVIRSSGHGLLQLIDEILDLSKIESGKMQLEYAFVSVEEILRDIQLLFKPMANEKNVAFNIHKGKNVPDQIETDKLRVEQILRNLISNALKFTNRGSIDLTVSVQTINENRHICFSVRDSGIGIPEEKQQLIFEAFQQADGSTKRKYGGTGLGLSISRQLARLLFGDITLTSKPNYGSEFILIIPENKLAISKQQGNGESEIFILQSPAPDKTITALAKPIPQYITTQIPENIPDDRKLIEPNDKIILIVEDDTAFAKALLDFSRQKGYKGIVAVRGDEGVELAQLFKPQGILLDIQLPVKDGMQVIDELKNDPRTRHIPVHMMSSFEVKREGLSKGAIDFISKPFAYEQMDHVFKKIEHVIKNDQKKVLIVEDNSKHAKALSYFLSTNNINAAISGNVNDTIESFKQEEVNCVILDMGVPDMKAYETLETVRKNKDLENIPIIIFTGKNISRAEEQRIKQYADSIVIKTAHSYQRILDEVSLFLHLVEENSHEKKPGYTSKKLGSVDQVLKNKTVLVADDDVRNIFSLTKALEKHKMNILSAMDGKEALQTLQSNNNVHIVLMDMMMPEMDGYETTKKIRENVKWKKLPVIAVTAKAMTGDREKCIQAGASDYISKPVDTDQLISLMRIWLYENA
ncbi:response regulator [Panacibacter ginsenosidivorans]|uniref:histidine kinase n=1 Tax=Panacibacter ginsenosidivorans TaxID=1813871 RepID=A0A5B8V9B4_9BACT|nr:response regulator [Panacibacter ginsenosidivorans]QEC68110.1 response regulator [Panacibacter ginsenosidivorans]